MVNDKTKKQLLFTSLVLAVAIFSLGIVFGWYLDNMRSNDILEIIQQNELDTESYLVEQQYIESFDKELACEVLENRVPVLNDQLGEVGHKLVYYKGKNVFEKDEFDYLQRKHFILKVRFWNMLSYLKKNCDYEGIVILYFYEENHQESTNQGYALDDLNKEYNYSLTILSFDVNYDKEPLIGILKDRYDIETTPTIIYNDKIKTEGFVSVDELKEILKVLQSTSSRLEDSDQIFTNI